MSQDLSILTEQQRRVFALRQMEVKFASIAIDLEISQTRANQIYHQALNRLEQHRNGGLERYAGLSARSANCLLKINAGKADVAQLVASDKLRKISGCGRKAQVEICRWAGVTLPEVLKGHLPTSWGPPETIRGYAQCISDPMHYAPILLYIEGHGKALIGTCTVIGTELWWRANGTNSQQKVLAWRPLPELPAK